MSQFPIPSRAFAVAAMFAVALAASPRVGQAAPTAADGAPTGPRAPDAPRALLASPLITIERIDGPAAGLLGGPGAAGVDGQVPIYLLDPDGFTTFTQVAPPDGGHLIMLVE